MVQRDQRRLCCAGTEVRSPGRAQWVKGSGLATAANVGYNRGSDLIPGLGPPYSSRQPKKKSKVEEIGMGKSGKGVKVNLKLWHLHDRSAISSLRKISSLIYFASATYHKELGKEAEKRNGIHSGEGEPLESRTSLFFFCI